jgi:glycerophosphoryl diester phosphodiesterase
LGLALDFFERELRSGDSLREKAAQRTLVKEVCPELGWLREFVVLNYTAVVKAVKKGNKNLPGLINVSAVRLLAGEPIFSSPRLAKLVERAEMLTVHAAPASERKIADYVCPLCDEVLSNPVMLPCEHRFCFKCITNVEKNDGDALEAPNPNERRMEIDDKHHKHGNSSSQDRWSKGALHRGACPVCREPNMNDESSLRVDDKLDEFIKTHFKEETFTTEKELSTQRDESDETMKDANTNANPASSIPKALIVVLAGCRSDAMLVSDAPTMSGFVRGSGCFSFHMAHTSWNGCGNTSSDAMMPLLTGSQGASLTGKPGAEKVYKKTKAETKSALKPQPADTPHTADVNVSSVFSRLSLVRSWVKVVAAIGGASDLAATIAAEHATEVVTDLHADDAAAAAVVTAALTSKNGNEDVIYLHLSGVQDAGAVHGYGPHVTEYRSAVERADALIGTVIGALRLRQKKRPNEDWLVVIASPAGGTTRADMPVTMQGDFDAADWSGGGGRQLRAAGVTGFESLPQHATGWVLVDMPAEPGFAGGCMNAGRACGELLPPPRGPGGPPPLLEHFGVAPRKEWGLDGNHLLGSRRTDTVLEDESRNRGGGEHFGDALANVTLRAQSESDGFGDGSDSDAANSNASDMSVTNFGSLAEFTTNAGGTGRPLPPANYAKLGLAGPLSAPGPFASHLPGLFEPTGCAVVGHRGFGMNRVSGKGIRENTVASFIAAHGSGAGWCEFDVQVTSDGVPVLFHDNLLLVRYGFGPVLALSIRELDLAELKAMSRAAIATAKAALAGDPDAIAAAAGVALGPVSTLQNQKSMSKLNKQQVEDDEDDEDEDAAKARPDVPVVFYRKFPNTETPAPWIMDVEDEIPTLEELMVHAPPELGLSMELKVRAFPNPNPASTFAHIRTRRDYYL